MVYGRHEDQETAGQGDVASDACAFFPDRLLGDLHKDFLALFEKIGDQGKVLGFVAAEASATSAASTGAAAVECRALGALSVACSRPWRPYFGARRIHGAVSASFGIERRLGFGLGFFQFGLGFGLFLDFFLSVSQFGLFLRDRLG